MYIRAIGTEPSFVDPLGMGAGIVPFKGPYSRTMVVPFIRAIIEPYSP